MFKIGIRKAFENNLQSTPIKEVTIDQPNKFITKDMTETAKKIKQKMKSDR